MNEDTKARVGELVSLETNDFTENTVHIQRQEIKKYIKYTDNSIHRNGYGVVPYTKSLDFNREIVLTQCTKVLYIMIFQVNHAHGFHLQYLMLDKEGNRMHKVLTVKTLTWYNHKEYLFRQRHPLFFPE